MPIPFRIGIPVDHSDASDVFSSPSRLARRQLSSSSGPSGHGGLDDSGSGSGSGSGILSENGNGSRGDSGGDGGVNSTTVIVITSVVVAIVLLVALAILLRTLRTRYPNPKYIPTPSLKKLWTGWQPSGYRTKYSRTGADDDQHLQHRMREAQDNLEESLHDVLAHQDAQARRRETQNASRDQASVDRTASVRSVMTLPAYRPKATDQEQVIGREGERDGIDTVVEMPTAEDEEAMREEEMEALYQIRLARRRQIAEREERRRERREARERRDHVALHSVRERARNASQNNAHEIEELRDVHDQLKQSRQRAVSSVSYADLGVVRADGSRLRANSTESERVALLSDAGSIALSTADTLQHRRARSGSSVLSIDTFRSATPGSRSSSPGLGTGRSRASSRGQVEGTPRASSSLSARAGSSPELIDAAEADLGDVPPPGYEDVSLDDGTPVHSNPSRQNSPYHEPPPDYPGPTQARQNRLSAHMADLAEEQRATQAQTETETEPRSRSSSRGMDDIPQLPSLRLARLPQIVIEPSSAVPR